MPYSRMVPFSFFSQQYQPQQMQDSSTPTMFGNPRFEFFFREHFAWQKAKGKAPQTLSQPKKPKSSSIMSFSTDTAESIQADPPPQPNSYTSHYFQDLYDPNQFMISNEITNFLSQANTNQIPTIVITTNPLSHSNKEEVQESEESNYDTSVQ